MVIRRWLAFLGLLSMWTVCISCGQNYRLPIIQIPGDPGDPKLYHFAMTISTNDPVANANTPGSVMQTDVVGDLDVGEAPVGRGPIFATLQPTGSANRIYVINGLEETVSTTTAAPQACSPGPVCPIGAVSTITMPAGSAPSYLNTTEAGNMYVILQNSTRMPGGLPAPPTVGVISVFQNVLLQEIALPPGAIAIAAMVELPNGRKLYVVDKTNGTVYVVDTVSRQVEQTLAVGPAPSMALASPDSSAVYVMTSGGVSVIDALTDQVIGNLPTGSSPSSITYDTKRNRLYVTEDAAGMVSVYDTAQAGGVLPTSLLATPAGAVPGAIGVAPLPDGSRFYVLGRVFTSVSTVPPVPPAQVPIVGLGLTGFDSNTLAAIPSQTNAPNPYPLDALDPLYTPTNSHVTLPQDQPCAGFRFRFMVAASADSGRVYVSSCDAGGTYIFRPADDTGVFLLPSPNQPPMNGVFKPQFPVYLIAGR